MTKECRGNIVSEIFDFDEFRGPFESGSRGHKGPKVAVLVIETYFVYK